MTPPTPRRGGFVEAFLGSPEPQQWYHHVLDITRHVALTVLWGAVSVTVTFLALLLCWGAILTAVRLASIV